MQLDFSSRARDYVIVLIVATVATWLATFAVRRVAVRFSIIVLPDERRVHERATPTIGGTAMFLGLLTAMCVASQLPTFTPVFHGSSDPLGVVVAAAVIFAVGLIDDLREMSPPAKVAGQVLSGMVLYFFGVNMLFFLLPFVGTTLVLSPDLAPVVTVIWVVGMANAVNLIDGLDGLAAGIVAIAATAFFLYSHQLVHVGILGNTSSGPLVAIVVLGLCLGFLPHNFHPARIFMGDAGAMLLGLLMASSTMSVVGQSTAVYSGRTYFFYAPVVIPFLILGIPMLDTAFALIRRAGRRSNPAVADKNHLHHRLMRLGHGQIRAVLILWAWTALLSALVLYPVLSGHRLSYIPLAVGVLLVGLYTLFAPRGRSATAGRVGAGPAAPAAPAPPGREAPGRVAEDPSPDPHRRRVTEDEVADAARDRKQRPRRPVEPASPHGE